MSVSDRIRHFFHVVSNVRPIYWILLYIALTPVFATIYWALPDSQFRIPSDAGTDWGSWLYYSIVTITTLGFGDYTPAHVWAQTVTAIEVTMGLSVFGFFLNAVGSMKSEIDVASEVEKQRRAHTVIEREKLLRSIPPVIHNLNLLLAYCYAVTTPKAQRKTGDATYRDDFKFSDMADLYAGSGLPMDHSNHPAVERLLSAFSGTALCLDSLQTRIDLALWPDLLEDCFAFVANYQMFASKDEIVTHGAPELRTREKRDAISAKIAATPDTPMREEYPEESDLSPIVELFYLIKDNATLATKIESELTKIASQQTPQ